MRKPFILLTILLLTCCSIDKPKAQISDRREAQSGGRHKAQFSGRRKEAPTYRKLQSQPKAQIDIPLNLALPTPNPNIFQGGSNYYMYVNRTFKGRSYKPWQGGQYGFVRTPTIVKGATIYKRFHEGIDIRPTRRDARGRPVDPVMSVDYGIVRHVNAVSGNSNYGKYIVIEHTWDGTPFYSLYAHLRTTNVQIGQRVAAGEMIGKMGWTGRGINLERAHLHFEINMLASSNFNGWHALNFNGAANKHGIYNGFNLFGIDVVGLYQAIRRNPSMTISRFLRSQPWYFKVQMPASENLQIVKRYPWLVESRPEGRVASWEIAFTKTGLPISARPSSFPVSGPRVTAIQSSSLPYYYLTRKLVKGSQGSAHLSKLGRRTMDLFRFPD